MKVLVLGHGVSCDGVVKLFNKYNVLYDYLEIDEVNNFDYLYVVKAPGILMNEEVIQKFIKLGIKVVTDIWVAMKYSDKKFIGITGSNGKTTTTLLIKHILESKYKVIACGNIGYSVCEAVLNDDVDIFIVELSSFQLECVCIDLDICVLLNVNYCHMDHHNTFNDYINAKSNIFINQSKDNYFIYCYDDKICSNLAKNSNSKTMVFSNYEKKDIYLKNNKIYFKNKYLMKVNNYKKYLIYDIMASIGCCKVLGLNNYDIKNRILSFDGVLYRCSKVNDYIYNDAKSTNPYSTIASVKEFEKVFLICGGYDRGESLNALDLYLDRISCVFCYGMSKGKIYSYFNKRGVDCYIYDSLEEAFLNSIKRRKEEIILYSPMFASFDMFENFKQRGKLFEELCRKYL